MLRPSRRCGCGRSIARRRSRGPADHVLRVIYAEFVGKNTSVRRDFARLAELDCGRTFPPLGLAMASREDRWSDSMGNCSRCSISE
jgi:hypothetical protein